MAEPVRIIEACAVADSCPERWADMEPVLGNQALRFCARCLRTVHACDDEATLERHLTLGRSVALRTGGTTSQVDGASPAAPRSHGPDRLAS